MWLVGLAAVAAALTQLAAAHEQPADAAQPEPPTQQTSGPPRAPSVADSHWRFDAAANCWVYTPWVEPDDFKTVFAGTCVSQLASGNGTVTLSTESGEKIVISGQFSAGQMEGHGTAVWSSGLTIDGEFRGGTLNGRAVWDEPGHQHYEGQFADGVSEGQGRMIWGNGDRFVGSFHRALANGAGTYTFGDGQTITGNFENGQAVGHVVVTTPKGKRIEGEFMPPRADPAHLLVWPTFPDFNLARGRSQAVVLRIDVGADGVVRSPAIVFWTGHEDLEKALSAVVEKWRLDPATVNGVPVEAAMTRTFGIVAYIDGGRFEGEFVDGRRDGEGVLILPGGSRYEGHFAAGSIDGQGRFVWMDGDSYSGSFHDGLESGHGVYICHDGRVYEGEFVKDRLWGHGVLRRPDGTTVEGDFAPPRPDPAHPWAETEYPHDSVRQNRQGHVRVRFLVKTDGSVRDARVIVTSGSADLDQSAIDSTLQSHMLPGTVNGAPIDIEDTREFKFVLQ